ncbi:hypothetical protein, partial [Salmonella enterica]
MDFSVARQSTSAGRAAKMGSLCRCLQPHTEHCMITLIIIAITAIVSFMAFNNARLMNDLI